MKNRQTNYFSFLRRTACFIEKGRRLTRFYPIEAFLFLYRVSACEYCMHVNIVVSNKIVTYAFINVRILYLLLRLF